MTDEIEKVGEPEDKKEAKRPFQYSLRSLLIFMLVAGVLLGWLGRELRYFIIIKMDEIAFRDAGGVLIIDYVYNDMSLMLAIFFNCVLFAWVGYKIWQARKR